MTSQHQRERQTLWISTTVSGVMGILGLVTVINVATNGPLLGVILTGLLGGFGVALAAIAVDESHIGALIPFVYGIGASTIGLAESVPVPSVGLSVYATGVYVVLILGFISWSYLANQNDRKSISVYQILIGTIIGVTLLYLGIPFPYPWISTLPLAHDGVLMLTTLVVIAGGILVTVSAAHNWKSWASAPLGAVVGATGASLVLYVL